MTNEKKGACGRPQRLYARGYVFSLVRSLNVSTSSEPAGGIEARPFREAKRVLDEREHALLHVQGILDVSLIKFIPKLVGDAKEAVERVRHGLAS